MIDRRLLTNFDWKLLTLILLLAAMGVMNIYSASASYKVVGTPYAVKQIYWIAAGMMLAVLSCSMKSPACDTTSTTSPSAGSPSTRAIAPG